MRAIALGAGVYVEKPLTYCIWEAWTLAGVCPREEGRHADGQPGPLRRGHPPLPRAHGGPHEDLFHGIKNGTTPCSNFIDSAGPLTEFVLAGHLAMFAGVGKKLEWDVEKMQCTNVPEINQYVRRDYRKGWDL